MHTIGILHVTTPQLTADKLSVALSHATETDVPTGCSKTCKFPVWFCDGLKFYTRKKNYFYGCFETFKSNYFPYTLVQGWPSASHRKAT